MIETTIVCKNCRKRAINHYTDEEMYRCENCGIEFSGFKENKPITISYATKKCDIENCLSPSEFSIRAGTFNIARLCCRHFLTYVNMGIVEKIEIRSLSMKAIILKLKEMKKRWKL